MCGILGTVNLPIDTELLDRAPGLKIVGRLGVGLDNIDLRACDARGIAVCPATGANDVAVAEYAIAAALILFRRVWQVSEGVIAGDWPRTQSIGRELSGKRLGLVGFGSIAREVAARARALGMQVSAFDPYLAEDAPDVVLSARIVAKAQELSNDPVRIYEFVRNELEFQNDFGLMKGPEGTLLARGGECLL